MTWRRLVLGPTAIFALACLAACNGVIGDAGGGPSGPVTITDQTGAVVEVTPAPRTMWRLTSEQYRNTIEDLFGAGAVPSADTLPADPTGEEFASFGSATSAPGARDVEVYHAASLAIAAHLFEQRGDYDALDGCAPTSASDPCVRVAIESLGRRLFRRPLGDAEVARYLAIVEAAETHPDAAEVGVEDAVALGMQYAVAALLDSPSFLYASQEGERDPETSARRYTSVEMASRLSYFVLDSTPDEELLDAGIAGDLVDTAAIEAEVDRMLRSPRGRELAVRFFEENWKVDRLPSAVKDADLYPEWSPEVVAAAMGELERMVLDVEDRDASVLELFSGTTGYANEALGAIYGVDVSGSELEPVDLGPERSGVLTSVAVLAANALPNRTSPTYRGVFVRLHVLCEPVPAPPADIPALEETDPTLSTRDRLEQHRSNPVCAGCHDQSDPLGLPFESFDAIGRFRTMEGEHEIDTSTEFEGEHFSDVQDLARFLESDPRSSRCVAYRLYSEAMGHFPTEGERGLVDSLGRALASDGNVFRAAVTAVVTSPGFRFFSEEE